MTDSDIIDEALGDGLNVAGDDTFDYAQQANDRIRAARRGQAILNDFWLGHEWTWRRATLAVEVTRAPGDEAFNLPGDFAEAGQFMSVMSLTTGLPIRRADPQTVQMALDVGGNGRRSGLAKIYCVNHDVISGLSTLLAAPVAGTDETANVRGYVMKPPVFGDGATEVGVPERYHRTVILRLLKREFQKTVGDARDMQELQEVQRYITDAWNDENPKNYPKRPPRYGRPRLRSRA